MGSREIQPGAGAERGISCPVEPASGRGGRRSRERDLSFRGGDVAASTSLEDPTARNANSLPTGGREEVCVAGGGVSADVPYPPTCFRSSGRSARIRRRGEER